MRLARVTRPMLIGAIAGAVASWSQAPAQTPATKPPVAAQPGLDVIWERTVAESTPDAIHLTAGLSVAVVATPDGIRTYALDTGEPGWVRGVPIGGAPRFAGTSLVAPSGTALVALEASSGRDLWRAELGAQAQQIAVGANRIVVVTGDELRAFNATGTADWRARLPAPPATPLVAAGSSFFVGVLPPGLVEVFGATGIVRPTLPLPTAPDSLAASSDGVYFPGADGKLYRHKRPQLRPQRPFSLVRAIGQPAVDERSVYVSFIDNSIRAFDRGNFNQRWPYVAPSRPAFGPLVLGDTIAVGLISGEVLEIATATGMRRAPASPARISPGRLRAIASASGAVRVVTLATGNDGQLRLFGWGHKKPAG